MATFTITIDNDVLEPLMTVAARQDFEKGGGLSLNVTALGFTEICPEALELVKLSVFSI